MSIINSVYKYEDGSESIIRIVAIIDDSVFYVNLNDKKTLPKRMNAVKLNNEVIEGSIIQLKDPYARIVNEDDIPEKYRVKRDKDYEIARHIWKDTGHDFLLRKAKAKYLNEIAVSYDKSIDTIKRIISRYLVRGMTRNALLNDYKNSGGSSVDKTITVNKRGRRGDSLADNRLVIDDTIKNIIYKVYKNQYLTKQKKTYKQAYYYMLSNYFSDNVKADGKEKTILWEDDKIPTYQQFMYWCKKRENVKEKYIKREGTNKYNLTIREQEDSIDNYVHGPNYKYEVDATIGDIYLVSEQFTDKIIGRPTIYAVMDVFSRLIVGLYVGLENPSWIGAAMALDNVVSSKVEYCRYYGIDIYEEEWPQSYLPRVIIADNGEFEGYGVNNLINNLDIEVINLPSSRGDLKPIVERVFRTINDTVKRTMPGAVLKERKERGEKAYWLEAKLNLKDFTKQVIYLALKHNKSIINHYMRDKEMLKDDVKPIPIELWSWGMKRRRTSIVKRDRNIVRLNLLPTGSARITKKGIRFKTRLYYNCKLAFENQWFINKIGETLDIVYDPRNMNNIYIVNSDYTDYEVCRLTKSCSMFMDSSIDEIEFLAKLDRKQKSQINRLQDQIEVDTLNHVQGIIDNANKREAKTIESNRQRGLNIRCNRIHEKELNRNEEYFDLDNTPVIEATKVIEIGKIKTLERKNTKGDRLSRIKMMKDKFKNE